MNFTNYALIAALLAVGTVGSKAQQKQVTSRRLEEKLGKIPVQTFYIPMAEENVFYDMFAPINDKKANPPIETMISVAISTDDTVIWYDHIEDGFDIDVTNSAGSTTEIWGDGLASNGCAPSNVKECTNATDKLNAGDNVVIHNTVPLPRDPDLILYDGGDRLQASFPVAVTRGAYPQEPGSLMAGAVEVYDTDNWGKTFEAPVGENLGQDMEAFEYVSLFYMAAFDDTVVTLPDLTQITLNQGESGMVRVNQSDTLQADKVIQVDLITGDVDSYFELRWYSLLPTEAWENSYVSPVGDTVGKTKIFVYNPNPHEIDISWTYLNETEITKSKSLESKRGFLTSVIPTGSGAHLNSASGNNFIALSLTDTEYRTSTGQRSKGQWYDWGMPILPTSLLTPQILIGLGYGCTDNNCYGEEDRSVIWLTAAEDADVYIDYNNTGFNPTNFSVPRLTSQKYTDIDNDMSGAVIWATSPGEGPDGTPVNIAAAWGQDPSVSRKMQDISLDLGTLVVPFPAVRVKKVANLVKARQGDIIRYTILLQNNGQSDLPANSLTVNDNLDDMVSYVPGSTFLLTNDETNGVTATQVPDDSDGSDGSDDSGDSDGSDGSDDSDDNGGTLFPLDENGYVVDLILPRRGGQAEIIFQVKIDGAITADTVVNNGSVEQKFGPPLTYHESTPLVFNPKVAIENTVHLVADGGDQCGTSVASDYAQGYRNDHLLYCFNVTNLGDTKLADVVIDNLELGVHNESIGELPPGISAFLPFSSSIAHSQANTAVVSAKPVYSDGNTIQNVDNVSDSDDSEVDLLAEYISNITIENKVLGSDDGTLCGTDDADDSVTGNNGDPVTYCFTLENIGTTTVSNISITNDALSFTDDDTIDSLEPGQSATISYTTTIDGSLNNEVIATALPALPDGSAQVRSSDTSSVVEVKQVTGITIKNTVYAETNAEDSCPGKEEVEGKEGESIVYCFEVTNVGETSLLVNELEDPELNFTEPSDYLLKPGGVKNIPFKSTITGSFVNNATVTAKPVSTMGNDLDGYSDVSASDQSGTIQSEPDKKEGSDKETFQAPNNDPSTPESCLQNAAYPNRLTCTSNEVFIIEDSLSSERPKSCKPGETVHITVDASIHVGKISALYNLGWYVATDGGDALNGTCVANGLRRGNAYKVVDGPGSTTEIGSVAWAGDNDACGDIFIPGGVAGTIEIPIIVDLPVTCTSNNANSNLDIAVCFTWRDTTTDDTCTLDTSNLYPTSSMGCSCEQYEVPNIKVRGPNSAVAPCRP